MSSFKVSLNLSGGGARGLAHIGVIQALVEHKIEYDLIVGVSMGAIVGANYAHTNNINKVYNKLNNHLHSEDFQDSLLGSWRSVDNNGNQSKRSLLNKINNLYRQTGLIGRLLLSRSILSDEDIEKAVLPIIPDIDFEDFQIPFVCTAVDLSHGKTEIFFNGPVQEKILASASMPLVFPPVSINNSYFIDGGVLDRVGVDTALALDVEKIIAVDVSNNFMSNQKIRTAIDVMLRSEEISAVYRKNYQLNRAAIVIRPIIEDIHWADYASIEKIVDMGYEATIKQIDAIKQVVSPSKNIFSFFRRKKSKTANIF